jgi:hypothetical protein
MRAFTYRSSPQCINLAVESDFMVEVRPKPRGGRSSKLTPTKLDV